MNKVFHFIFIALLLSGDWARGSQQQFQYSGNGFRMDILKTDNAYYVTFRGGIPTSSSESRRQRSISEVAGINNYFSGGNPVYFFIKHANGGDVLLHKWVIRAIQHGGRRVHSYVVGRCQSACIFMTVESDSTTLVEGEGQIEVHLGHNVETGRTLSLEQIAGKYDESGANGDWARSHPEYYRTDNRLRPIPSASALDAGFVSDVISRQSFVQRFGQSLWRWIQRN